MSQKLTNSLFGKSPFESSDEDEDSESVIPMDNSSNNNDNKFENKKAGSEMSMSSPYQASNDSCITNLDAGKPFLRWVCGLCFNVESNQPRAFFTTLASFESHNERFCHQCMSEFTNKQTRLKHFLMIHCRGKSEDEKTTLCSQVTPLCFQCEGCSDKLTSYAAFEEQHAISCDAFKDVSATFEERTERFKCFGCGTEQPDTLENLFFHFMDCSVAYISDAQRTNGTIKEVKEALHKQIIHLNGDVTRNHKKLFDVIAPVRSCTFFPRVTNLPVEKTYLEEDIKYLRAVLTPINCRPVFSGKKILDRSIRKKRGQTFQIIEVEIPKPKKYTLDSCLLPGRVSPSAFELSDSEPEPCYLLSELPELAPCPNERFERPLMGTSEQGWQVLKPLSRRVQREVPQLINLDGNADLSDVEDDFEGSLEEINSSQEPEAQIPLKDCPQVCEPSTNVPSPIQQPFCGFVDCLESRSRLLQFPSGTSTPGPKSGSVPFSDVSFLSNTDEPMSDSESDDPDPVVQLSSFNVDDSADCYDFTVTGFCDSRWVLVKKNFEQIVSTCASSTDKKRTLNSEDLLPDGLRSFTGKVDLNDNSTIDIDTSTDSNSEQNSENESSTQEGLSVLEDTFSKPFTAEHCESFFKDAKNSTELFQSVDNPTANDNFGDSTQLVHGSVDESGPVYNPSKTLAKYFNGNENRHYNTSDVDESYGNLSGDTDSEVSTSSKNQNAPSPKFFMKVEQFSFQSISNNKMVQSNENCEGTTQASENENDFFNEEETSYDKSNDKFVNTDQAQCQLLHLERSNTTDESNGSLWLEDFDDQQTPEPTYLLSSLPLTTDTSSTFNDPEVYGTTDSGWLVAYKNLKIIRYCHQAPTRPQRKYRCENTELKLKHILNMDGAWDLTDTEDDNLLECRTGLKNSNQPSLKSEIETGHTLKELVLSCEAQRRDWEKACPRVYSRLLTFDDDVTDLTNNQNSDSNDSSDFNDSEIENSDSSEIEQLVRLSTCRSDLEDSDNFSSIPDVEGTDDTEWVVRKSEFSLSTNLLGADAPATSDISSQQSVSTIKNSDISNSNIFCRVLNRSAQSKSVNLINLPECPVSVQVCNPFHVSEMNQLRRKLNVDGACDFSDSEEEENIKNDSDADFEVAEELEDSEEVEEHGIEGTEQNNQPNGASNSDEVVIHGTDPLSEEVFVKLEENVDVNNVEEEFDPIDHLEVDMPPTYSAMTSHASGINRIQKTNAPQTPQKCSNCKDEDKWFNTRDALLAHDVFYHGKEYCAPCDLFFPDSTELDEHVALLHLRFTCDKCGVCVEGKENYTRHYLDIHRILHCLLCSYSFTTENVAVHMIQGHRIPEGEDDSSIRMLSKDFSIIFDETKLTAKCNLCFRKFTREKIYNHLRYFHHSSSHQIVGLLQEAKFNLAPGRSNQLQDVVIQELKTSEIRPVAQFIEFEGRSGFCLIPHSTSYNCPIKNCPDANEQKQDAGIHLLMDHSMSFCFICGGFFSERRHLCRHYELSHATDEKNTCNLCPDKQEVFQDNFSLSIHLRDFHCSYMCPFCENLPFESSSELADHVQQYHDMWKGLAGESDQFYDHLLYSTLVAWDVENCRIECNMCSTNSPIDDSDLTDWENFRRHLSKFHSIRYIEKLMAMYDSVKGKFSIQTLDFKNKFWNSSNNSLPSKLQQQTSVENSYRETASKRKAAENNYYNEFDSEDEDASLATKRPKKKTPTKKLSAKAPIIEVEVQLEVEGEDNDEDHGENSTPVVAENADESEEDLTLVGEREVIKDIVHCELCSTTTLTKQSMRRHCLQSHDLPSGYFRKDICHSCNHCELMFWSVADKVQHVAQAHSNIQASLEKCFVCFHISPNKHALRRHFKRMHPEEKLFENVSYKCPYCGDLFELQKKMYDHIKEDHPDRSSHPCRQCDKKFTKFISWKKHQEFHKQETIQHTCTSCGTTFDTKKKYLWHIKNCEASKKEPKLNFKCKLCELKFADRYDREIHYKQVHPNEPMYPCAECGVKFNTKSARWSHSFSHKADDTFKCEHCSKTFNRRDTFREHLLIHTGPRYRCTHCPKEFVQRSNLRRHIRIHLGIKPYNCKFCPLTFSDKGACNSHMKIHTGDNKEKCTFCGQEFSKGQKLRYHMRLHTGEGLLTCDLCQKVFTNSYSLKTHLKRVHAKIQDRFPCYFCERPGGYEATNRKSLKSHIDRIHKTDSKQCRICLHESVSLIELNMHMMTVHFPEDNNAAQVDDGGYQCRHCESKFPGLSDIKRHLTEEHEVKTGFSMHYLNRYINEANFPTLAGEPHTQLSVVLVSSEPTLNAKARRKEEAKIKREQKLQEKMEQEQLKMQQKLEKQQQKMAKQEHLPKLKIKLRKPAKKKKVVVNPLKIQPLPSPDVDDIAVKSEPEDSDSQAPDTRISNEFLQRMRATLERNAQQFQGPSHQPEPFFAAAQNFAAFNAQNFLELQQKIQTVNALRNVAAHWQEHKNLLESNQTQEQPDDDEVQIKAEPDIF